MGLGDFALGAAPIAGGLLVGSFAGNIKPPDYRAALKADLDILDRLPPGDEQLRDSLYRSIQARIGSLVAGVDRSIALKQAAATYQGHWRDAITFLCAVLFTVVWWHVDHHRGHWKPMFVLMIVACVVTAIYAVKGILTGVRGNRTTPGDEAPLTGPAFVMGPGFGAGGRAGGPGPNGGPGAHPGAGPISGPNSGYGANAGPGSNSGYGPNAGPPSAGPPNGGPPNGGPPNAGPPNAGPGPAPLGPITGPSATYPPRQGQHRA